MEDKTLQAVIKLKDEMSSQLKIINDNLKDVDKSTKDSKKSLKDYSAAMKDVGKIAVATGGAIVAGLGTGFAYSIKQAMEYESAFAGVKKTVEATKIELEVLSKGIRDMSNTMPQSAVELAAIAESAGQLGIQKDKILEFTKTVAMLADATNLTSEEAATSFAQIANVTRMSQDQFDELGSTIVALGNNGASSESQIIGLMNRVAASGKQVNMSIDQIASWSSAMASLGINAEAGGTSFNRTIMDMQIAIETNSDKLGQFAKVAGMSASQFKKAFKDDASGALFEFVKGLSDTTRNGKTTIGVLDDLGISSQEQISLLNKLAGGTQTVEDSLKVGNQAWKENNALINEANQRYGTTESQLAMMRNQINNASIDIGNALLPVVRDAMQFVGGLATSFSNLDPTIKQTIIQFGLITLGIGAFLLLGGGVLMFVGGCITAFTTLTGVLAAFGLTLGGILLPITVIVLAIMAIIGTVILVRKAWEQNWGGIRDTFKSAVDTMTGWWNSFTSFITEPVNAFVNVFKNEKDIAQGKAKRNAYGGKITRNNELRRLHEGEKVLTKQEANNYEKQNSSSININISEMTVREEADINKIANELARKLKQQRLAFAGAY